MPFVESLNWTSPTADLYDISLTNGEPARSGVFTINRKERSVARSKRILESTIARGAIEIKIAGSEVGSVYFRLRRMHVTMIKSYDGI